MSNEPKFKVGDRVRKVIGSYAPYEMTVTRIRINSDNGSISIEGRGDQGQDRGDDERFFEHVVVPLADLIAEKETLIADITKQLADAKAQLEALTAPKVGDIYHGTGTRVRYKAKITSVTADRIGYDVTGCLPYHKEGPYAKPLNEFLTHYKKA